MRGYRSVLLDIDGTLIDSNDAHARAWVDAFRAVGRSLSFARVRPLIGMGADQLLPALAGLTESSDIGQAITRHRARLFATRYLPRVRPFSSARELLRALHDRRLTLVVATSAKHEELTRLLELLGAGSFIDGATSSDDVARSKPEPDIVRAALERAGSDPAETVLLGDTPYDLAAARTCGVDMIAFRCGGFGDAELRGAVAIVDGPHDLLVRLDELGLEGPHRERRGRGRTA